MKSLLMVLCVVFVAGCARPPIYSGLGQSSYGNLRVIIDERTNSIVSPPSCDPKRTNSRGVNRLSSEITKTIMQPFSGVSKVDETLIKEDLQDHFKMPGDPGGHPLVAILERGENNIVFWHLGNLVEVEEVAEAAKTYCSRLAKTMVYEGSARECGKPKTLPMTVNSERVTVIETYVISSFRCKGEEIAKPLMTKETPVVVKSHSELIQEIQNELMRLKYLPNGKADGKLGSKTKAAIVKFQSKYKMSADGLPTESLLNALKSY